MRRQDFDDIYGCLRQRFPKDNRYEMPVNFEGCPVEFNGTTWRKRKPNGASITIQKIPGGWRAEFIND